jgi:hypothetical protein
MKSVFEAHGIPCARHRLVSCADEARAFARETSFPLVAKPSRGGRRAEYVPHRRREPLRALASGRASHLGKSRASGGVSDRGRKHSFDSVMVRGSLVFHSISRYLPTPLEVLENPWVHGS